MKRALARLAVTAVAALALLGAAAGCANPDRPVSHDAAAPSGPSPQEGVEGRVRAAGGGPVSGALVQAESLDRPANLVPELAVTTREDGRYLWPLPPGRYRITVSADGFRPAAATATVAPGHRAAADFELSRLP